MKLSGKKALIVGGNSGIGLATARLFVDEGAEVAITGRDPHTLEDALRTLTGQGKAYRADIRSASERQILFEKLQGDFGSLNILFANAGILLPSRIGETDEGLSTVS